MNEHTGDDCSYVAQWSCIESPHQQQQKTQLQSLRERAADETMLVAEAASDRAHLRIKLLRREMQSTSQRLNNAEHSSRRERMPLSECPEV